MRAKSSEKSTEKSLTRIAGSGYVDDATSATRAHAADRYPDKSVIAIRDIQCAPRMPEDARQGTK